MSTSTSSCTNPSLWMGDLETYMDEGFIRNAFKNMGQVVHSVKFLIDKKTGSPAGYCFVNFGEISLAKKAHLECNGTRVPHTSNKRFKLNYALASSSFKDAPSQPAGSAAGNTAVLSEYSLHVSNLSPDVTDVQLFDYFAGRFKSVKHATVVKDGTTSRGYGFVRFYVEADVHDAIRLFNGAVGLGLKAIRVGKAVPKETSKSYSPSVGGPATYPVYSQQQQQYSQVASQFGTGYGGYYDQYKTSNGNTKTKDVNEAGDATAVSVEEEDDPLVDPELTIDVEKSNRQILETSEELYQALEASRWQFVDSITMTYDDLCKA